MSTSRLSFVIKRKAFYNLVIFSLIFIYYYDFIIQGWLIFNHSSAISIRYDEQYTLNFPFLFICYFFFPKVIYSKKENKTIIRTLVEIRIFLLFMFLLLSKMMAKIFLFSDNLSVFRTIMKWPICGSKLSLCRTGYNTIYLIRSFFLCRSSTIIRWFHSWW